jgi:hypothetical protein
VTVRHSFATRDGELEAIEKSLSRDDYVTLPCKPYEGWKAATLTSYKLDRFRWNFAVDGRHFPALVREFWDCKSVIILRPDREMIIYTSDGVTPLSNLWARLRRGDTTAPKALDDLVAIPAG